MEKHCLQVRQVRKLHFQLLCTMAGVVCISIFMNGKVNSRSSVFIQQLRVLSFPLNLGKKFHAETQRNKASFLLVNFFIQQFRFTFNFNRSEQFPKASSPRAKGFKFQSKDFLTKNGDQLLVKSTQYSTNPRRGRLRKLVLDILCEAAFRNRSLKLLLNVANCGSIGIVY